MLFCLGLIAILLYDSVLANAAAAVCNQTFTTSPGQILAESLHSGPTQCDYYIQAPTDSIIKLNFTHFYGFGSLILDNRGNFCLPKIKIVDLYVDAKSDMDIICNKYNNFDVPQVFHSKSHLLNLSFVWLRHQPSGFLLQFDFQQKSGPCEFTCTDNSCLPSWSLVCNGFSDCLDFSDEQDCNHKSSGRTISKAPAGYDVSNNQIIIIVIAVVLTLGVIVCVVSHYKMGARSWSERRTRHNQAHQHHSEDATTASAVLYVPTSTQDRFEREAALQREKNIRLHSIQTDMQLELPPSISLPDGEELYNCSCLPVHLRDAEQESEIYRKCVRPPPNRTVFDGESPPPYRSNSVGVLSINRNKGTPPRIVRDLNGAPHVMRCYSMGHQGNTRSPITRQSLHCSGHSPLLSSADSLDLPPDYSEVVANPVIFSRQLPLDSDV